MGQRYHSVKATDKNVQDNKTNKDIRSLSVPCIKRPVFRTLIKRPVHKTTKQTKMTDLSLCPV